ncbi:MAG: tRNA delta(2)-isopentenylpyrophosphate transferase [Candidatus Woesebacteria bacterium GW2011_GWB1_40_12]|uniref:tRNA dimethylallyltransferase n=1 Tax=Candidatus Woesebacteria bacterium GW2011_GWB1_40_12 TaxID=1618576 RepID=A0A0G0QQ28_9BACT|nr:MAG: tRNA delta(2)-isopentenylpyrophosphate transferase [Candidatus Woesebacteria bacterium GW2011_GWB1_40_12]
MKVFVIVGPTSTGKTSLSVELCKKLGGEIISADSRQIYKYMDVGTGKLPIGSSIDIKKGDGFWELDEIKVWGYDLVAPDQYFSSYDFAEYALEKTQEIFSGGKNVFLVGGTGYYVDTVTGKLVLNNNIEPDFELRSELEKKSLPELQSLLTSLNLEAFQKIDKKNPVRLIRAIEKEKGQKKNLTPLPRLDADFIYIGLSGPREFLYSKADRWVEEIWKSGLVSETEKLLTMNFGSFPPLRGLVYKSSVSFINKEIEESAAVQRIKFDIHAYIRRQQTWFKRNPDIKWFDVSVDSYGENVYSFIKEKMKNG